MTITPYAGTVPDRSQSQDEFNINTQAFLNYIDALGPEINTTAVEINALATITVYSASTTYNTPDTVYGSDGLTYRCAGTSVLADNPVGSVTGDWVKLILELTDTQIYPVPSGIILTGNMQGLGYEYTSAHVITVAAGACYDSTNATLLSASVSQTVTIGSVINEIYSLFLCDDGVVRPDTHIDGDTLLSAYSRRWIGFVLNDSSGDINQFTYANDSVLFETPINVSTLTTSFATIDFSNIMPVPRCEMVQFGGYNSGVVLTSRDGTMEHDKFQAESGSYAPNYMGQLPWVHRDSYFKYKTTSTSLFVHGVTIKR